MMKNLFTATLLSFSLTIPTFAASGDDPLLYTVSINELETQFTQDKSMSWDGYAWIGYNFNKIYLYSEADKSTQSQNQLMYSRAIAPFWDVQVGLGYDVNDQSNKKWAVIAIQGLAPYFFDTRVALLIGKDTNIGLRVDLEHEALLTQKLILKPNISADIYSKDSIDMKIGKNLSNITIGLRLRYEIVRKFAPYIGLEWTKNYGNTNKLDTVDETYATIGLRAWF
jgi:copper resistance protein B